MKQPRYYGDVETNEQAELLLAGPGTTEIQFRHSQEQKKELRIKTVAYLLVFCLIWLVTIPFLHNKLGHATPCGSGDVDELDFEQITPSEKLEWHPCRQGFFCARLTVPMDYNRPLNASKDNPKVHLALLLKSGQGHSLQKSSVSPLLLNPGGPGGSGVLFAQGAAQNLQIIVDLEQDVIGFDPRGIGATTPRLDCFSPSYKDRSASDQYGFGTVDVAEGFWKRIIWYISGREAGIVNSTTASLSLLNNRAKGQIQLCDQKDQIHKDDGIFRHVTTPNVARDMISIIDAWDEWRATTAVKDQSLDATTARGYTLNTKGKLMYWGFSYGTLLGATFAALFPDRVGRVVLDGVVDADHYVGAVWTNSIVDADKIFETLPKYCFDGKENCPLYKKGDSEKDVSARFYGVLASLKEEPLTFISSYTDNPMMLKYEDIKQIAFSALYDPNHFGFYMLARIINAIVEGDMEIISGIIGEPSRELFQEKWPEWVYPSDAQLGILCGDKRYLLNNTLPQLQHRFEKMSNISQFGDVWMTLMMTCNHYNIPQIDPPLQWGKHPVHKEKPINTSFPLLYLSNTLDPVTPLSAALKMALKFQDAGLVEQEAMGHCTLSSTSFCTFDKIKKYFTEGKVPGVPVPGKNGRKGDWERCTAVEKPFKPINEDVLVTASREERGMAKAAKGVREVLVDLHTSLVGNRYGGAFPFGMMG